MIRCVEYENGGKYLCNYYFVWIRVDERLGKNKIDKTILQAKRKIVPFDVLLGIYCHTYLHNSVIQAIIRARAGLTPPSQLTRVANGILNSTTNRCNGASSSSDAEEG